MNYRHAFHAGNFADLVKHAALLELLAAMTAQTPPLTVIDTHAGRGLYDLCGEEARKSGEAEAGILRLVADANAPDSYRPLISAFKAANPKGPEGRIYPGSPWLIAQSIRPGDAYLACELRAEEHGALQKAIGARPGVKTACVDGYEAAQARCPATGNVMVLIDPPFEKADDYRRIVETVDIVRGRNPDAVLLIWLPLKDLETFDGFLRDLEDLEAGPLLVAETRLRPLSDPMKMNGCALVFVGAPADLEQRLEPICQWPAQAQGEGGKGRVWRV